MPTEVRYYSCVRQFQRASVPTLGLVNQQGSWLIFLRHFSVYPVLRDLLPLLFAGCWSEPKSVNMLCFCSKYIYTHVNPEIKAL